MENDFNNHYKYRNNFNKFQLPGIKAKAPFITKKNIDTSPFKRVIYQYIFANLLYYRLRNQADFTGVKIILM